MGAVDIIVFAMIAALILLRLRAELGNRPGSEPRPPAQRSPYDSDDPRDPLGPVIHGDADVIDMAADPAVRRGLTAIRRADPGFDSAAFLAGAKEAYGMILTAFWSGDRETLQDLVDQSVLTQFLGAIDARESAGQTLDNKLLAVEKASLVGASLDGPMAEVTVEFAADLVAVTRDSAGEVISGTVSDSVSVTDQWSFQRNVQSDDPRWLLMATKSA